MKNNATHMVLYAITVGWADHLFIQNACVTCVTVLLTVYIICMYAAGILFYLLCFDLRCACTSFFVHVAMSFNF